jgi:Fe-S cluster assembly protein SufB
MDEKEKLTLEKISFVEDINRDLYDFRKADHSAYKAKSGLTEEVVRDISKRKHDPQWMLDFRLKSLEIYNQLDLPTWGPDISSLDMDHIVTYVQPDAKMVGNWKDVPDDIKDTFDRLGIPRRSRNPWAASARSTTARSSTTACRRDMAKQGVIYTDMETAIRDYEPHGAGNIS